MKSLKDQLSEALDGKYIYFRRLAHEPLRVGKFYGLTIGGNVIVEFNKNTFPVPFYMVYTFETITSLNLTEIPEP